MGGPFGIPDPLLLGDGSASSPTYSFAGSASMGMFRTGSTLSFATAGTQRVQVSSVGVTVLGMPIRLANAAGSTFAYIDQGGDNIVEIRNGTAAQTLRIYGTTTGSKYLSLSHDGTDAFIATEAAGIGDVYLRNRLLPFADGTYDHGSSSRRWKDIYAGTSLRIGTDPASTGSVRLANLGSIVARDFANLEDVRLIRLDNSNYVRIGDITGAGVIVGESMTGVGFNGAAALTPPSYGTPTGTATRTTFNTATVTTAQLAERVYALIQDLQSYGLLI